MRIDGRNWFPYLPPSWLQRLTELVQRSVPQRIDSAWLLDANRFSITQGNASQFVSQLRTLDWIDDDGGLTERGRNLRLSGQPLEEFMRAEVGRVYEEIDFSDEALNRDGIETYFMAASNLGLSGRRQVIATLRWFLSQAGLEDVAERLGGSVASRTRTSSSPRSARNSQPSRGEGSAREASKGGSTVQSQLTTPIPITISISLQLPAVENEEVYEAIFKAMREHLLSPAE